MPSKRVDKLLRHDLPGELRLRPWSQGCRGRWSASQHRIQLVMVWGAGLVAMLVAGCGSDSLRNETSNPAYQVDLPKVIRGLVDRDCGATFQACTFSNGQEAEMKAMLEIVGGGVGCVDFDRDGNTDLFFPRGGKIDVAQRKVSGVNSALLRGDGNWGFRDCTPEAGVATSDLYSHGITTADYDHDGFDDLLVYGYGGVLLLRNNGDGTFGDATQTAALAHTAWTTAATWIDINGDQSLDLYLGSYLDWDFDKHVECFAPGGELEVCSPNAFGGVTNTVFLSNGDGGFTRAANLLTTAQAAKTLGTLAAEFKTGQGVGLYVANDLVANFLFTQQQGEFREHGFSSGVAVDDTGAANGSMGVALLDFNLDKQFDLFVTNFEHERMALYANIDGDSFEHVSRRVGLNQGLQQFVAFGVVAADFDGDADEDVCFTCGHVHYYPDHGPMAQTPVFLRNEAGKTFTPCVSQSLFFANPAVGRGLATADFDNDGDLDLVGTKLFGPPAMVENAYDTPAHWLTVTLVGVTCSRTPIGATVELNADGYSLVRQLYGGGSYLSQSSPVLHFAWPSTRQDDQHLSAHQATLQIRWPDGSPPQSVTLPTNQHAVIVQDKTFE